jgi:hypothetical protein
MPYTYCRPRLHSKSHRRSPGRVHSGHQPLEILARYWHWWCVACGPHQTRVKVSAACPHPDEQSDQKQLSRSADIYSGQITVGCGLPICASFCAVLMTLDRSGILVRTCVCEPVLAPRYPEEHRIRAGLCPVQYSCPILPISCYRR